MPPPPRPLFVHEIIPKAVEVLEQHQQRILSLTGEGTFITQPDLQHTLDLCKQILETEQR